MIYTLVYSIINIYSNNIFSIPFGFLWRFSRCCCCSCVGILCARKNTLCTCRVVHNISFRVINYGFVLLFIYFVLFSCPFVCVCAVVLLTIRYIAVVNFVDKHETIDEKETAMKHKNKSIQFYLLYVYIRLWCLLFWLFRAPIQLYNFFGIIIFNFSSFTSNTHSMFHCYTQWHTCRCRNSTKSM